MSYESECAGKVRHKDRRTAKQVARRVRRRDHDLPLNAYRCTHCGFWHTGRMAAAVRAKTRAHLANQPLGENL